MIIAHHLMWTAYGWWLPNDPRGSTSHFIASDVIASLGELHYGRRPIQPAGWAIRDFYGRAPEKLEHSLLKMEPCDFPIIADGLAETIQSYRYTCWACTIMPDHVHILIRKHRDTAEQMIGRLQTGSMSAMRAAGRRGGDHPVWGGPGWKVFQDCPEDVERTIAYIEGNPGKMGLAEQTWGFVKEYDEWPLHPGHSPCSPYATRKKGEPFRKSPAKPQAGEGPGV
jgi:REP element-mobilizing transposase RayT